MKEIKDEEKGQEEIKEADNGTKTKIKKNTDPKRPEQKLN